MQKVVNEFSVQSSHLLLLSSSLYTLPMPKPYVPNDKWSQRAHAEGFRARSVYKLEELDTKFRLLKPGQKIIDIGAAPGSWLQYASQKIGPQGQIVGIDLKEIEAVADNVHTFICDVTNDQALEVALKERGFPKADLILSDIAPNTSGIKDVDQWRSIELNQMILHVASNWLKPRGRLVMKVFRGADFDEFLAEVKQQFAIVKISSVKASRDRSREVYVVCGN